MRTRLNKVIGVDVDLTVVNSALAWFTWLNEKCGQDLNFYEIWADRMELPYNISTLFDIPEGLDPFDFWRKPDLYDDLESIPRSSKVIRKLYEMGYDIVFISYCFDCGTHSQSKVNFLKREFDFITEKDFHFVQTRSKGVLSKSLDYMVDDRIEFLNQMEDNVNCIMFNAFFEQDEKTRRPYDVASNWFQVFQLITGQNLLFAATH